MGAYRGTSLIRNRPPLRPYCMAMSRALWWSEGGGQFLISEVPLYAPAPILAPEIEHKIMDL